MLTNLLSSRRWEDVKPVAFTTLAEIIPSTEAVQYARMCLHQSSSLLSTAVLNHCRKIIPILQDDALSLSSRLENLQSWIFEGWGDLTLSQAHADDVSSFRLSSDILLEILMFFNKSDVLNEMNQNMESISDFFSRISSDESKCFSDMFSFLHDSSKQTLQESIDNCEVERVVKKSKMTTECLLCGIVSLQLTNSSNTEFETWSRELMCLKENMHHRISSETQPLLDSTKELQPLILESKRLPLDSLVSSLKSLIQNSHSKKDLDIQLQNILSFVTFWTTLTNINPLDMKLEAARSIDEYARNPSILLNDIHVVLENNLSEFCVWVEEEVAKLLSVKLVDICDLLHVGQQSKVMSELAFLLTTLYFLENNKNEMMLFILKKKKIYLKLSESTKGRSNCDEISHFLECLRNEGKNQNIDEFNQGSTGLSELILEFCKEKLNLEVDLKVNSKNNSQNLQTSLVPDFSKADSSCLSNKSKLESIFEKLGYSLQDKKVTFEIPEWEINIFVKSFDKDFIPFEELKKDLENVMKCDNWKVFPQLRCVWASLCQHLVCCLLQPDLLPPASQLITQLKDWVTSQPDEFDSDGDNDPHAIDCF